MADAYGANSSMRELFGAPQAAQAVVVDEVKEAASKLGGMKM